MMNTPMTGHRHRHVSYRPEKVEDEASRSSPTHQISAETFTDSEEDKSPVGNVTKTSWYKGISVFC